MEKILTYSHNGRELEAHGKFMSGKSKTEVGEETWYYFEEFAVTFKGVDVSRIIEEELFQKILSMSYAEMIYNRGA